MYFGSSYFTRYFFTVGYFTILALIVPPPEEPIIIGPGGSFTIQSDYRKKGIEQRVFRDDEEIVEILTTLFQLGVFD